MLITGGASGFGAAIAAKFVSEGAKVVITDLSIENGTRVATELGCTFVQADVTKRSDWELVGLGRGPACAWRARCRGQQCWSNLCQEGMQSSSYNAALLGQMTDRKLLSLAVDARSR